MHTCLCHAYMSLSCILVSFMCTSIFHAFLSLWYILVCGHAYLSLLGVPVSVLHTYISLTYLCLSCINICVVHTCLCRPYLSLFLPVPTCLCHAFVDSSPMIRKCFRLSGGLACLSCIFPINILRCAHLSVMSSTTKCTVDTN